MADIVNVDAATLPAVDKQKISFIFQAWKNAEITSKSGTLWIN